MNPRLGLAVGAVAVLLAGCSSVSPDGGFGAVQTFTRERLGHELASPHDEADRAALDARVAELLARPLGADDAVQLALLNHRGLQAAFHELGIADAERAQAGRLRNPGLDLARLSDGESVEWDRSVHLDLAGLLSLPGRRAAAARRFERAQADAAQAVLAHAARTRQAWVQAVAAQQALVYAQQVADAAQASAELARRMRAVGNFNALQQLREQAFEDEASLGLLRARQQQQATRERLARLLGLWGEAVDFRLPERLPELPALPREAAGLESLAVAQRIDLQAARAAVDETAAALGVDRVRRVGESLELAYENNRATGEPTQRGWGLGLELPLFDDGSARVARAQARHRQAVERAAQAAIDARSEVREAHAAYTFAWQAAKHQRDALLPLHQRIAEENLLRYNGMLIGVFELLADARRQIAAVTAALDAQRDFWLADATLQSALLGAPVASPAPSDNPAAPVDTAAGGH